MGKDGKKLIQNKPSYGTNQLVSVKQDKEIKRKRISFSFSYFNQLDYFGIGMCSSKWYISLIERLKTLGTMTPEEVLEDNRGSDSLRCHNIDWNSKNIPIKRKDLNWLPNEILNNDAEFPIMQFSVSTGTGRIVGFFDRGSSVFYIVLLDPHHNVQPARKTKYQIQPTTKGVSQYDDLLSKLEKITTIVSSCSKACELHNHINSINEPHNNIIYFGLEGSYYNEIKKLSDKYSLAEIFEYGILALSDKS